MTEGPHCAGAPVRGVGAVWSDTMRRAILLGAALLCAVPGEVRAASLSGIVPGHPGLAVTEAVGDLIDSWLPGVTNLRLGLGPVVAPAYEGSDDYDLRLAPLVSLRYRNLIEIDNNDVRLNVLGRRGALLQSTRFSAGPTLKVDFGRSAGASPDLAGLGDVDTSIEVGAFASYAAEPWRFRLRLRQDVANGHGGLLADADVGRIVYRRPGSSVAARLSTTWASGGYMRSLFGVDDRQAVASGLPAFAAGAGMKDVSVSAAGEFTLVPRLAIVLHAGVQHLLGDARRSPIVRLRGSAVQFNAGLYVTYSFD